jgi:alkanesulfonate monooxygenase SsuD/methylene tetrahydromethanopterin reductase-like flavin-dependent oxidoreductase (luciferase family)
MTIIDKQSVIGYSVTPATADATRIVEAVGRAEAAGLDLVGIQDHPYQRRFLDTFALIGVLLGRTERISLFPNVANLPLRPPALLAKHAATLDVLSGGRFELGLGAGAFWEGIAAYGGPRRTPGQSVDALSEAIDIIRRLWAGERGIRVAGKHYRLEGAMPGPLPAHDIGIWVGAYKPRMLRLTGRQADGWIPSLGRTTREELRDGHARIDQAAADAGRDPKAIRRLLNISGRITAPGVGDTPTEDGLAGPPDYWQELLQSLRDDGFNGFVFWPAEESDEQIDRLAGEVAPALRAT